MITAQQASQLVAQNTIAGYLRDIEKEIVSAAANGNIFTQVKVPGHVADSIVEALEAHNFSACQSYGTGVSYIDIRWPLHDTLEGQPDQEAGKHAS